MKNKRSQAQSIIMFFVLAIAIFAVSIIILRITNSVITPFKTQIGNFTPQAGDAVQFAQNQFTHWWDYAIILMLLINIIFLLVSAFLVDIHPAFLIVYIFAMFFLVIFGNFALGALDSIWGAVGTSVETAQTPLQQFVLNNFQLIMIGVMVLSGIVMYAKFKWFGGMGSGGNS